MESEEEPEDHHHQSQRTQNQKGRPFLIWVFAVVVVFVAILLGTRNTESYNKLIIRYTMKLRSSWIGQFSRYFGSSKEEFGSASKNPSSSSSSSSSICVLWMAPFLSSGGYSSESWSYVAALDKFGGTKLKLMIRHHGDLENIEFWNGLPDHMKRLAFKLYKTECDMNEAVVICHSEPGAWTPPLFDTDPCPPYGYDLPAYVIGRTMFETDRVNSEHVTRCNRMNSVWVPTDFHVSSFVRSGIDPRKVVKIVQSVDTEFFDPSKWKKMNLPLKNLVFGVNAFDSKLKISNDFFVFLSIFKWERRKGWDILLYSYLKEFSAADKVVLYLLTNPFHSDRNFANKIVNFVEGSDLEEPLDGWPLIYVNDDHIPQSKFPRIYKAADAFVLPSRGEGWGRPHVEAMAMSIPVIATNWSGPTEYMNDQNSFPIPVSHLSEVTEGPFEGHLWAEPSVADLRSLMREVFDNPDEARRRGKKAREDMIRRFSPETVAGLVIDELMKVPKGGRH